MRGEVKGENVEEGGDLKLGVSEGMGLVEFNMGSYGYKRCDEGDGYSYGVGVGDLRIRVGGRE